MNELSAIGETLRVLREGGGWDQLRASAGAPYIAKSLLMFVLPGVVGVIAGIAHWRDTPLAQKFGVPSEPRGDWMLRAQDRIKLGG
jgi:hypothetical protein